MRIMAIACNLKIIVVKNNNFDWEDNEDLAFVNF